MQDNSHPMNHRRCTPDLFPSSERSGVLPNDRDVRECATEDGVYELSIARDISKKAHL